MTEKVCVLVAVVVLFSGQTPSEQIVYTEVSRNGLKYMENSSNHQGFWKNEQLQAFHWYKFSFN